MSRVPTESTADTNWPDEDAGQTSLTLQPGVQLGRFIVEDFIGNGGMGVVYEATHLGTGARVALKTLHRINPRAEARLKDEFRFLVRLRDDHLVQLYELHTVDERCFLTMEFIDGELLTEHLRAKDRSSVPSLTKVRETFSQIALGLLTLHSEGLLHLDLKPDNVMVDRSGTVKILDFGLASPLDDDLNTGRNVAGGTPRYMAPERRSKEPATEAADWFSFGVMLTEILCPAWTGPGTTPEFPPDIGTDLEELCRSLLRDVPDERLDGSGVLSALGTNETDIRDRRARSERRLKASRRSLVGRSCELDELKGALAASTRGGTNWVEIRGESGVGKTALARTFEKEALGKDVFVLRGACHERESVPYQGMEQVMEALAKNLALEFGQLDGEPGRNAAVAAWLFAAFRELCPETVEENFPTDPVVKRRRAFSALKSLLALLLRVRPVVVIIDDIQWGDADGARLLAEILANPTPARLLVITTSQAESGVETQFTKEVEAALDLRSTSATRSCLHLSRLSNDQVRMCLQGPSDEASPEQSDVIIRAAGGLPFLADALGTHSWKAGEEPSLEALIEHRLRGTPSHTLEVLRAVSLAPSPLPQAVALCVVPEVNLRLSVLAALRSADLVRTSGSDPEGPLMPYHSLISASIQARMSEEKRREVRLHLAQALTESGLARAEQLATLYHLAGETCHAARLAPIAAQEAEAALAFETAAYWYRKAAEWTPESSALILPKEARCLEYAARSAAAALVYEAVAKVDPRKEEEFTRAAGAAWLNAGYVDRGLATLAPELERLRAPLAKSERAALLRCLKLLYRLWRRGVEFVPQEAAYCDASRLARVDALWNAGKSIGVIMPMRGLALQLECMHAALDAREPLRAARSLALIGPMTVGSPMEALGHRWMERAHELGEAFPNLYLSGILTTFDALTMCARWDSPAEVAKKATEGLRLLKNSGEPSHWEQAAALGFILRSKELLCDINALREGADTWLAESVDRGDLFSLALSNHVRSLHLLAEGKPDEAERAAKASVATWSQSTFTVQHYLALKYEINCNLYRGEYLRAQQLMNGGWRAIVQAQLLRNPISRPEILLLKAIVELNQPKVHFKRAATLVRLLEKKQNPVSKANGMMIDASIDWSRDRKSSARNKLENAIEIYQSKGFLLSSRCAMFVLGRIAASQALTHESYELLHASGVVEPHLFVRTQCPPFEVRE